MALSGIPSTTRSRIHLALAFAAVALGSANAAAQQPAKAGVYTAAQANAGRAVYQANCGACHLPDLKGSNEALPLAGGNFIGTWRNRTTSDLFNKILTSMPPGKTGSLGETEIVAIVAFILQSNAAPAGNQALSATSAVPIGDVATGQAAARPPSGDEGGAVTAPRPAGPPAGLTVSGDVKNYVPVTDEMLLHPDPGDWLMVRGNYQAWNHSPLTQINRDNVSDLRLAWVWSMNDQGGANEPTPLVHNGIIYLTNPDNIVQALDAKTGELIWENRIRPAGSQGGGTGAMRNLAIYQDKIFAASTDAHLFALDARTGKTQWDIAIADTSKGYGNSSGPIIIGGRVIQGLGGCDRYKAQDKEQGCFISAFDPNTGKLLWRFNTEARAGELGGDTWGKLPNMLRVGGETWITGSYDPELNLTYGVWLRPSPGCRQAVAPARTTRRSSPVRRWRCDPMTELSRGISSMSPARLSISMKSTSASSWISATANWPSPSARPASSGSWTERRASSSMPRRPSSRTSLPGSMPKKVCSLTGPISSRTRTPANGFRPARAPRAATTGRP